MQNWIFIAAGVSLVIPLGWVLLRSRGTTFDIEPVSSQWLQEQKRAHEDR